MAKTNDIVERPRNITEAVFELNQGEMDIVDIIMAMISVDDDIDDNLNYSIAVSDYAKYFGLEHTDNAYKKMKKATQGIHRKVFTLYNDDSTTEYSWFQQASYKTNQINVMLGYSFKKMLVELKKSGGSRAIYNLKYSLPMKCQYAKRIYYLLKQWENTGKRFDKLEDLIVKLRIPQSYNLSAIKRQILDKAVSEINLYSDLTVSYTETYEYKGKGRPKVVGITWTIEKKEKSKLTEQKTAIEHKENGTYQKFEKAAKNKPPKGWDIESHDYDFDEIERLERERLDKLYDC